MTSLDALVMLPWTEARRALGDRPVRLRVLRPPYPALGVGSLRALRVGEGELVIGYDGYERL